MKIICTPQEATKLIYNCGGIEECSKCAFKTICEGNPQTMIDMLYIKGRYSDEKFIKGEEEEPCSNLF